jgi:hypothetical protein
MNNSKAPSRTANGLDRLRGDLGQQFARLPDQGRVAPRHRRRSIALVAAVALVVPATVALAGGFDATDGDVYFDGKSVTVDGRSIECPASEAVKAEMGGDPCAVWLPAEAPADGSKRKQDRTDASARGSAPLSRLK